MRDKCVLSLCGKYLILWKSSAVISWSLQEKLWQWFSINIIGYNNGMAWKLSQNTYLQTFTSKGFSIVDYCLLKWLHTFQQEHSWCPCWRQIWNRLALGLCILSFQEKWQSSCVYYANKYQWKALLPIRSCIEARAHWRANGVTFCYTRCRSRILVRILRSWVIIVIRRLEVIKG